MDVRVELDGVDRVCTFLARYRDTMANDLMRYMATCSSRVVAECRKFLNAREGGYDTGELHRSIRYQIEGNKYSTLISSIGPTGMQKGRTEDFGMLLAWWMERGFTMRPHFVPFHRHPAFDNWAVKHGIDIPAQGGGLFIRGKTGKMRAGEFPGRHFMREGFKEAQPFIKNRWSDLVAKWRSMAKGETA